MEAKTQRAKKYWKIMEIVQIKSLLICILLLSTLMGCAQKGSIIEDPYYEFKKEVYTKLKHPDYKSVLENCLLDGFVLTIVKIDNEGIVEYDMVFATNSIFKDAYFESLKKIDVNSLMKNTTYLIPIVFKLRVRDEIRCSAISSNKELFRWISEFSGEKRIDYIFEPFEFYGVTPIS